MPGVAKEVEKLREHVLALDTSARVKLLKVEKSPATRWMRERSDIEAKMAQAGETLDDWNVCGAEFEACVTKLEKQLEQSASWMRVAEFKFSLLYDKAQSLKK